MEIKTSHSGRIHIEDGNTIVSPMRFEILIFDDFGLSQVGNGIKYAPPTQIKNVGDKHVVSVGDYEIEIRRVKPKITNNKGIISLKKVRRFREKVKP